MNKNNLTPNAFLSKLFGGEFKFYKIFWWGMLFSVFTSLLISLITNGSGIGIAINNIISAAWLFAMWQARHNIKRKFISYATLIVLTISLFIGLIMILFEQQNLGGKIKDEWAEAFHGKLCKNEVAQKLLITLLKKETLKHLDPYNVRPDIRNAVDNMKILIDNIATVEKKNSIHICTAIASGKNLSGENFVLDLSYKVQKLEDGRIYVTLID